MSDWMETVLLVLCELLVLGIGIAAGYRIGKAGAQDRIETQERQSYEVYAKQQKLIEELATQRDECRRFVREWAAPIRPVKK